VKVPDFTSGNFFAHLDADLLQATSSDEGEGDAEMQGSSSSDANPEGPNARPAFPKSISRRRKLRPDPNVDRKRNRRTNSMSQ
jgi:hypothetical protein